MKCFKNKAIKLISNISILLLLLVAPAFGAVRVSTAVGGTWNVGSTWVGGVAPLGTDSVIITSGSTVSISGSTVIKRLEISGILKFTAGGLNVNGTLLINPTGNFQPFGRSFAVSGNFVNNGTTPLDLSQTGTTFRMGTPDPVAPTSIGGTGSFKYAGGIIRTLRIDNEAGVTLSVPVSVAATLELLKGTFVNGSNLTLNNTAPGLGAAVSEVKLVRHQTGSLASSYSLNPAATLNVEYGTNITLDAQTVNEGAEIPLSRTFNSLTINNPLGVNLSDDITLTSAISPLVLRNGKINVADGKTIVCSSTSYHGAAGSSLSFINGAVALSVGTVPTTKTFPLGKGRQSRTVAISGIAATSGVAQVRFEANEVAGGTTPAGKVLFGPIKWSGSALGNPYSYTSISFESSFLDGLPPLVELMGGATLSGSFSSLGMASQDSGTVSSAAGSFSSLGIFAFGGAQQSYSNSIAGTSLLTVAVKQYEKAEWDINVSASFLNPYRTSEIAVDMVLISPSSKRLVLPCFYVADRGMPLSKWKARFLPQEAGTYNYKFILSLNGAKTDSTGFQVFNANASAENGILHYTGNPWVLTYDSGKPFRGIGNNIGWENRDDESYPSYTYDYFVPKLAAKGSNFLRTFMNNYNLPLEWNNVELKHKNSIYKNSSEPYNPTGIKRMDEFVEMAEQNKLPVMLMVEWQCNLRPDVNWYYNPYNAVNGGPAATPADFFTNPLAKQMFKDRLRFMIARWGYSPAIGMWELMNEIDNALYKTQTDDQGNTTFTDSLVIPKVYALDWHKEMSAYLKQNDPYKHIVTTSIGFRTIPGLWSVPDIDINQEHMYNYTDYFPSRLTGRLADYNKPTVFGEFARDYTNPSPSRWGIFNYDFKKGLWYGLFNATPVLPINWFWVLWESQNGFDYYARVREVSDQMLAAGNGSFIKKTVTASGLLTAGVKCGSVYFAHILNNDVVSKSSSVIIDADATTAYSVKIFDPETGGYALPVVYSSNSAGKLTIPAVTYAVQQQKVIIATPVSLLPVELGSLRVKREGSAVKLSWRTTSEKNNDFFKIERSADAIDFHVLGKVKGQGNSNTGNDYAIYDLRPSIGQNYYRLTQYDNDGQANFLGLKTIDFGIDAGAPLRASFNTEGNAVVFNRAGLSLKLSASLADIRGSVLVRNLMLSATDGQYRLDLPSVPPKGIYILTITDEKLTESVKIKF
ncbi:DUF5060 domain-containing protein [Pedobacter sp.]